MPALADKPWDARQMMWHDTTFVAFTLSLMVLNLGQMFRITTLLFVMIWGLYIMAWPRRSMSDAGSVVMPWLLPLYAVVSVFWSRVPYVTVHDGVEWLCTVWIAIIVARRITPRQFMIAMMLAELFTGICSLIVARKENVGMTGEVAFSGIFLSKNSQAWHVSVLILASFSCLTDKALGRMLRLLSLAGLVIGMIIVIKARSLGALLTVVLALGVYCCILCAALLPLRLRSVYFTILLILILMAVGGLGLILANADTGALLNSVGKNSTLTGRSILWAEAWNMINLHPLSGMGLGGFWQQEFVEAEGMWRAMKIVSRAGFQFHNSYLNYGVDLGYPGMALFIITFWGTVLAALIWAVRFPGPDTGFVLALLAFFGSRSGVEGEIGGAFSHTTILVSAAWVFAIAWRGQKMRAPVRLTSPIFSPQGWPIQGERPG